VQFPVALATDKLFQLYWGKKGVFVNDSEVIVTDLLAVNGVVHVIDAVMVPESFPATVVDIIVNSEDHETLEDAVIAADLDGTLSGEGPFTVFAPTDAAFAELPDGLLTTLLDDPSGTLTDILLYHVVGASAIAGSLSDGDAITTLLGEDVTVSITNDGVFINDTVEVIVTDLLAVNGVVHVIDAVLVPQPDLMITENDTHGNIITDGDGNTLYFFTPDADGTSTCIEGCLDNWPVFYDESLYLGAGLDTDDFGSIDRGEGVMQTTYKGWPLYYFANDNAAGDVNGDGVINKWFVAKPDYTVMLMDNQLVGNDGVNYTGDYTAGDEVIQYLVDAYGNTLYTWVNDRNERNRFTAEDFSNNGAWPIFDAEGMVYPSTLSADDFDVIDVHGESQITFKGWPLYNFGQDAMRGETKGVSVPSPGIWPVAVPDMMEAPAYTVVDVVVSSPDHTTLEAAVIAADLAGTLSGDGPFTVFAPTDDAFAALPESLITNLLADPTGDLANILKYHVVGSSALSGSLTDEQAITTLLGEDVTVTINDDGVFINNALVTAADIVTDNGVVHVIDAVLVPESFPATVVDIIVNSEDHTTLEAAVIAADLVDALSGDGPFTVFAPTDDAFAALPDFLINNLLADPSGALTEILQYHVVEASALSGSLEEGQTITTLLGEDVTVTINNDGVFINDAEVIVTDILAVNGVVHVIDAVMVPESFPATVVDIIVNSEDHTTLEAAVIAADLVDALSGDGPFTVFAPTDDAFAALPDFLINNLLADPSGALTEILQYHVVEASALSGSLEEGQSVTTLLGEDVTVTINNDGVFINDAEVIVTDILAANGIVHVIDAVMVPESFPATVVDIIVNSDVHTTLETAVLEADLAGTLSGDGPFTVFAPTDAAFDALPDGLLDDLLADPSGALTDILQYHVVGATAMSGDLSNGQMLTTLQGQDVTVTINDDGIFINDAEVIIADLLAGNGVVHVIDAVITPSTNVESIFTSENDVRIFPNPVRNTLNIEAQMITSSDVSIEIYNIVGKRVYNAELGNRSELLNESIDISSLPQGVYIMTLRAETAIVSKKFNVVK